MTYYMKPPRGNIALHTLQKCVQQRLEFLVSLENGEMIIPKNFEYLNDGTSMDRAGHYLLRLMSLSSVRFKEFFLHAESKLFSKRLSGLNYIQVINMIKILYKHVQDVIKLLPNMSPEFSEFLLAMKHVSKYLMKQGIAIHTFNETHPEVCSIYTVEVPFRVCLPFVQNREVELKRGKCSIPCGKWKNLLIIFFHLHLEFGMKHLHSTGCLKHALNDSRIYQLAQDLGKRFQYDRNEVASDSLTAKDVNDQSIYFPPCMAHLYQTLKTRHRLSHEARRQFTLFLKDIGMTVDEALTFWSTVYSLPSSSCDTGCTHSWQKDARRYRYSIRHMYGLEGGRYSYRVSSCNKIQKTNLSSQAEGGCPFHHFDDNRMLSIFSSTLLTDKFTLNQIMHLKGIGKPQEACHTYLTAQQMLYSKERTTDISHEVDISKKLNSDKTIKFNDAVQFYLHLTST